MRVLVCGGNGFVGSHIAETLLAKGAEVWSCDTKRPATVQSEGIKYIIDDLREPHRLDSLMESLWFGQIYQCAATVGGAGFSGCGDFDADILRDSILINANILNSILSCREMPRPRIFFASSAVVYPADNAPGGHKHDETCAYPAMPGSEYGWEKLLSERLYLAHYKNYGIPVRIGRFHNVFGSPCSFKGGKETSIAAFCRMVAGAPDGGQIDVWGDGNARRSYIHIDDCVNGVIALMARNDFAGPVNIGSDFAITINDVCKIIIEISGKNIGINHIEGPSGARCRISDNTLAYEKLDWKPEFNIHKLRSDLWKTYKWIEAEVQKCK